VSGSISGDEIELYILKATLNGSSGARDFVLGSVIQSRKTPRGDFEISMFSPNLRPNYLIGYLSSIGALDAASIRASLRPRG
jgi:hypothetical protein